MAYLGSWKIDDYITFCCNTHNANTGNMADADAVPTYQVYEDETGTPLTLPSSNMAKLDDANTTGFYSERVQLLAANGFEKGKAYTVYIQANVSGVLGTMHHQFQIEAEVDANTVSDKTGFTAAPTAGSIANTSFAANAITAAVIDDNAIDAASLAANAITAAKIADGAIDVATFAANAINAAVLDPDVATEIAVGVWANATRSLTDKTGFTAAPTAGSIANTSFAANAITAAVIADGAIDSATFAANAINAAAIADGAIDAATFAANAINAAAIADGAIDAATFATNAVSATALDIGAANKIANQWAAKTGANTTIAYENLLERIYRILNNPMIITEANGAIALRNEANSGNVATGTVQDAGATTERTVLTWV